MVSCKEHCLLVLVLRNPPQIQGTNQTYGFGSLVDIFILRIIIIEDICSAFGLVHDLKNKISS